MCSALNTKTLILWQDAEQTFSVSRSPFGFLVILTHSPLQKYTKTARTVTDVWARGFKFDIRQKSVSQFYPYSSLRHYRPLLGTPSYMRSPFTCRRVEPYTQLIHCFAVKLTPPALMLTTRWERYILTLKSCVLLNYYVKSTPIIQI